jgi:hypothetical protein
MRARLALFAAAAIVFAPGANFGGDSPHPVASGLAASMLAPTFDEPQVATYQSGAFVRRAREQDERRSAALVLLAVLVGMFFFAKSRFAPLIGEGVPRRLRRFVKSHRDRGPPHLQFA